MNESECVEQVARLFAAFPASKASDKTADVYCEALVVLQYSGGLRDAVDALIASERWLPTIALVREEYQRHRDKYLPPALPSPDVTDEQRAANVVRARAMRDHLIGGGGHGATFEECDHPGCAEARQA